MITYILSKWVYQLDTQFAKVWFKYDISNVNRLQSCEEILKKAQLNQEALNNLQTHLESKSVDVYRSC